MFDTLDPDELVVRADSGGFQLRPTWLPLKPRNQIQSVFRCWRFSARKLLVIESYWFFSFWTCYS